MLGRLKFLLRRWALPKIDQGMTDLELYRKVRDLAGDHSFSIWRWVTRHAHHNDEDPDSPPKILEPTISITISIYEYSHVKIQVQGATNGEALAALELGLIDKEIRKTGPAPTDLAEA